MDADADIERVTTVILDAADPPEYGVMASSALRLRRHIDEEAPRVKNTAKDLLRVDDPRRVAVEKSADEAIYRAQELSLGDGLDSAFTYCRSLARIVRELRGHRQKLDQLPDSASRLGGHPADGDPSARPPRASAAST
ncbi:DUF6415 family natural product biosynthesis protein [Streptomyces albireticuli]|uniref:Uncharacterized protein n=1 Tax=Streptomyces albireticuli TaxID=1940 RepID=A0A2A2D8C6_9ACTN|nr:DUF6415 family natural product biosynthesis protein [Streptomyces albireticuli]MCD9145474.1 DUF6415 family natural product biosynthesis protein [Streptomyces albireticuli]MCD9164961.1 DUF6415 family natural product biosynthesis protein [Streptomyces albireticuli]MCD9195448.1 DUF6415 family natural product biosynthesis protein [Streptomyces albireticuli]PAU48733.1 hypothetical protein CK936_11845 [Streptomyces albireticuli]